MPGYEPFLLCDFHVHTQWSDGKLSVSEVVDLYGSTGKFDVIAITDHILMKKDLLARAGRLATLGRRAFGVREQRLRALPRRTFAPRRSVRSTQYGMLVVPGAEITQNRLRGRKNSHIIALDIKRYISADQSADEILREIRRQDALSIACHPHHRTTRRIEISTCYLWDHREQLVRSGRRLGGGEPRRSVLGDEPEALPVRRQQRLPQAEAPLLVEDARPRGEELAGGQPCAARQRRHRADAVSQRILGGRLMPRRRGRTIPACPVPDMNVAIFTDNDFDKVNGVTTTFKAALQSVPAGMHLRVYTAGRQPLETDSYLALRSIGDADSVLPRDADVSPAVRGLSPARAGGSHRSDAPHDARADWAGGHVRGLAPATATGRELPHRPCRLREIAQRIAPARGADARVHALACTAGAPGCSCRPSIRASCSLPRNPTRTGSTCGRAESTRHCFPPRGDRRPCARRGTCPIAVPRCSTSAACLGRKGLLHLPAISDRLHKRGLEHRFIIVGDGPLLPALRQALPDALFSGCIVA